MRGYVPYVFTISQRGCCYYESADKGETPAFITRQMWSRDFYGAMFSSGTFVRIAKDQMETPQCILTSLRELVINTHVRFVPSTGCCLPASGTLACVCSRLMCTDRCLRLCAFTLYSCECVLICLEPGGSRALEAACCPVRLLSHSRLVKREAAPQEVKTTSAEVQCNA